MGLIKQETIGPGPCRYLGSVGVFLHNIVEPIDLDPDPSPIPGPSPGPGLVCSVLKP